MQNLRFPNIKNMKGFKNLLGLLNDNKKSFQLIAETDRSIFPNPICLSIQITYNKVNAIISYINCYFSHQKSKQMEKIKRKIKTLRKKKITPVNRNKLTKFKSHRSTRILVSILVIGLLTAAILIFLLINDQTPGQKISKDVDNLFIDACNYIGSEQYQKARNLLSEEAKKKTTIAELESMRKITSGCKGVDVINWNYDNGPESPYAISGKVNYKNTDVKGNFTGTAVKEKGQWRILSFNITIDSGDYYDFEKRLN
jgi:hypothetical protein